MNLLVKIYENIFIYRFYCEKNIYMFNSNYGYAEIFIN